MSKRLVLILLCLLLLGAALGQNLYLNHFSRQLCRDTDALARALLAGQDGREEAEELYASWQAHQGILSSLIQHDEVDQLHATLLSLLARIWAGETEGLTGDLQTLYYYIQHIARLDDFSLENIF